MAGSRLGACSLDADSNHWVTKPQRILSVLVFWWLISQMGASLTPPDTSVEVVRVNRVESAFCQKETFLGKLRPVL